MNTWFCIPSKRTAVEANPVLREWKARGYRVAVLRDCGDELLTEAAGYQFITDEYPGYSMAVNWLVSIILRADPEAEWIVTGGDDVLPDAKHTAEQIAHECTAHFGGTFGVMQPTGDTWRGSNIEAIAGSPWMGREFCERAYRGHGPMWPEYYHQFNDEELQCVAIKLGCFWQRKDLVHEHRHWGRAEPGERIEAPAFLERANSVENWKLMSGIFHARKMAGFPGHEPKP